MALSRYDPFMGSSLYDPFSLFLGAPLGGGGGGGQLSSSRGGGQQQLSTSLVRPLHLDVKGNEGCSLFFLFFLFRFCGGVVLLSCGKKGRGRAGWRWDFAEERRRERR